MRSQSPLPSPLPAVRLVVQPRRGHSLHIRFALTAALMLSATHGFSHQTIVRQNSVGTVLGAAALARTNHLLRPCNRRNANAQHHHQQQHQQIHASRLYVSSVQEEEALAAELLAAKTAPPLPPDVEQLQELQQQQQQQQRQQQAPSALWLKIMEKIGTVDDDRLIFPDYDSGLVPRMFSSLQYSGERTESGKTFTATHAAGSVLGAAALVSSTTIGAGVLALPTATAAAGFLPSSAAMVVAYIYMTFSGLLIAELTLNRMADTGRPPAGLLDLYENSLGKSWTAAGSAAYFFLHYAMMVAYIAQGGINLDGLLTMVGLDSLAAVPGASQVTFAAVCGGALYAANPAVIAKLIRGLVLAVAATFMGTMAIGAGSVDLGALVDASNQHPDQVANCFPILFLSLAFQTIVPTIVGQLEGDRTKITKAIVAGTTLPLVTFVSWNAIVLGNVMGMDLSEMDPIAVLQSGTTGSAALGPLVSAFSSVALLTSLIGFSYGLVDAWADVFGISSKSTEYEKYKAPLFGLVFLPPLAISVADPDIFFNALEYGGAFGVSTLFLVLPPLMVWKQRYGEDAKPLMTKPMVPFGKLTLGSMWKAAGTLIIEQGADKLGVFDFFREHMPH